MNKEEVERFAMQAQVKEELRSRRMAVAKVTRKGITYCGSAAKIIEETPEDELCFYDLIDNLTDALYLAMERQGMTKADLARAMDKSRASVTKNLAGETNFTIKTLAKYLTTLNHELIFHVVPVINVEEEVLSKEIAVEAHRLYEKGEK